jgi:predicted HTH domain antitoxin
LERYYSLIKQYYWSSSIIIQEIYTPIYTGIIKKSDDNFIIEVAKGHFVAKGGIPTSSYILDINGNTINCNEVFQNQWSEIVEGFILERINDSCEKITLNDNIKKTIITQFTPLFEEGNITIEFGLLETKQEIIPYLIDYVADEKGENIKIDFIQRGIISSGKITGKLVKLELDSYEKRLHKHFHNSQILDKYEDIEPTIFYAELPSIEFIDILNKYNNRNIGFVFKNGSILCHLSILLRERGIPAIFLKEKMKINDDNIYTINTSENEMIRKVMPL